MRAAPVRVFLVPPFELPVCPLRGTPPALRVWSPLPSALLFCGCPAPRKHVSQLREKTIYRLSIFLSGRDSNEISEVSTASQI